MVDAAPGALPSRREGLAAFRPTTGGVVYARRLPVRPVTAGSVASGATSMTRRLGRRRRGWNKSSLVPRGDEAQRRSHPGLVDGGYQLKIVKHAPARRTSVDEIVFGHDLDGDGCCDDLEAAGVGLCAAARRCFWPWLAVFFLSLGPFRSGPAAGPLLPSRTTVPGCLVLN